MPPLGRIGGPRAIVAACLLGGSAVACADELSIEVGAELVPPVTAVSRSHLPAEAEDAITQCFAPLDRIVGIGLVSRARDVPLYVRLDPRTLELQTDAPAWVIKIRGPIEPPLSQGPIRDPVCIFIQGVPNLFGIVPPGPNEVPLPDPPRALPPLGP